MADALISIILEQLCSIIQEEVRLVVGVRKDVEKLITTFKSIQAVLVDAEEKQLKNKAVKVWLDELRNVAYDMEDVLDEWSTEILRSKIEPKKKKKKVNTCLFFPCVCFSHVSLRHDIGHKIKEIKERLDAIANDKDKYHLVDSDQRTDEELQRRPMTSSVIDVLEVCGRTHEKDIILSKLLCESSRQEIDVPIISVHGIGGIGKTTLAQMVFNDDKVKTHFEKSIWVCVSEPFDEIRLAKAIIEAVVTDENLSNVLEWEALHRRLCNSVRGKKFLLVLDDVWTEDRAKWSPLKIALNGGAQGSRIVVTSRSEKVARMMRSTYEHKVDQLSDEDCWFLFSGIAFAGRGKEECDKLEEVGKEITKKCKGVPLFLKTLASLMLFKRTRREWLNVLESDIWELPEVEESVLPALLLSYRAFPSHLKRCFTSCAVFPKDSRLQKDVLIKLWMAQGLLSSTRSRELELVGGESFDELVLRSFFQDLARDEDGNVISCKMHDLVHDFAQFLTKTECFIMDGNNTQLNTDGKVSHLYVESTVLNSGTIPPTISREKNVRTLIFRQNYPQVVPALSDLFCRFTCLRALSLRFIECLEELPSAVEKLIHLRYFDLSGSSRLKELPETICNLYNLQTLKLNYCKSLCKLPRGIGKMINLRHLEIKYTRDLRCMPQGIGRLSSLRSLSKFIVGGVNGEGCKIGELKDLNLLTGDLEISGLERVADANEANEANLKNKQHLHGLRLSFDEYDWKNMGGVDEIERIEGVLEGLQPHRNLEKLRIQSYPGSKFPSWIDDSMLSNLVAVKLVDCRKCVQMPALGKFRFLQKLKIVNMDEFKFVGQVFGRTVGGDGFVAVPPRLKELDIYGMANMEEWDLKIQDEENLFPCLSKLSLWNFPKLKVLPALGNLPVIERLKIGGMESIKRVGLEFLGMFNVDGSTERLRNVTAFPYLKNLKFANMGEWEEWEKEDEEHVVDAAAGVKGGRDIIIMPRLHSLKIQFCPKLKELPHYIFPSTLRNLHIDECSKLSRTPCLPPLLEELTLWGDVGVLSRSLPTNPNNKYNHLKSLDIIRSPHSSLPEGLAHLTALQYLNIYGCNSLMRMSEELQHLTSLQHLDINKCPILGPRCRKEEGEDWSIISHIPNISIYDDVEQ